MKKITLLLTIAAFTFFGDIFAQDLQVGFVNFKVCVEKSKQGQREKVAFDSLKKQMSDTLEKTGKELQELAQKLEDADYMDGLSPAAEDDLKKKFQVLNQEFSRYQNQYYQLLNQANYKMLQMIHDQVSAAAENIRAKEHLALILNEDSTFAFSPSLDLTQKVIQEMDQLFDANDVELQGKGNG